MLVVPLYPFRRPLMGPMLSAVLSVSFLSVLGVYAGESIAPLNKLRLVPMVEPIVSSTTFAGFDSENVNVASGLPGYALQPTSADKKSDFKLAVLPDTLTYLPRRSPNE